MEVKVEIMLKRNQSVYEHEKERIMHKTQRSILVLIPLVIVAMFIYPPFIDCGYHFITSGGKCQINVTLLLIQWIVVLIVGVIAFFIAKKNGKATKMRMMGT